MPFTMDPGAPLPADVEGLIFDCDGTLVDTMPLHYRAWVKSLEPYGLRMDEETFYSYAGMPTTRIIENLSKNQGIQVVAEKVAIEKENLYTTFIPSASPISQVIGVARREFGKRKLSVASGGWQRLVKTSLEAAGILALFPVIVGADDVTHGKPDPEVFLTAAARMGIPPAKCVVYEDGELGFIGARRAGMRVVDVRPWYMDSARLALQMGVVR